MDILIKDAEIIDDRSPLHKQKKNIFISGGFIKSISDQISPADTIVEGAGLQVSIGWFDMRSFFGDPGYEYKEDLDSGCRAAAAGGFTDVALLPNSKPVVQSKNAISYLKSHNYRSLTQIHPIGAATIDLKGEDITEMIDMKHAGAVAFSDGFKPIWNTDILLKSLLYLKNLDALLIQKPEDKWLNMLGMMNESAASAGLGLKGMPAIAEAVAIERDLRILEYCGGRLHFANISTARAVDLVRNAKKRGLQVTCDIAAHQLSFTDDDLSGFDSNLKVNPPFRGQRDILELKKGLQDGTIDAIVTSHNPQDEESKMVEFDMAEFGIIGLQTAFPLINNLADEMDMSLLIRKITVVPRKLFGLPVPEIKEGAPASLTVFSPDAEWVFDKHNNYSRSANSPFLGKTLRGKAVATINNDLVWASN